MLHVSLIIEECSALKEIATLTFAAARDVSGMLVWASIFHARSAMHTESNARFWESRCCCVVHVSFKVSLIVEECGALKAIVARA